MKVLMHTGGIADTNCFLAVDEPTGKAVMFDAPNDTAGKLLDEARKNSWDVIGLWLTHGHFDHMADHAAVTQAYPGAKVLIHRLDEEKLRRPEIQTRMFMLPFEIPPRPPDQLLEDGQTLLIGQSQIQVIHTPGHASGHVCYYCPSGEFLIGGDLIIMGAVGRTDLPDADYDTLMASIRRIMQLPPSTRLLPGHGDPSTLAEEQENNPYVREALAGTKSE